MRFMKTEMFQNIGNFHHFRWKLQDKFITGVRVLTLAQKQYSKVGQRNS